MNERPLVQAPEPAGVGGWLDAYMPDNQLAMGQPSESSFINFAILRGVLFRQRWIIAASMVAALVAGVVLTLLATPMYVAQSKVQVTPWRPNVVEGQDVEQTLATSQISDYMATQAEFIRSQALSRAVAADLELGNRYDLLGKDIDEGRPPNMSDSQWLKTKEDMAAAYVKGMVNVEVPRSSYVMTITIRSDKPALAAEIANGYAAAFVASDSRTSLETNKYARDYLADQINIVRKQLEEAEVEVNDYARQNGIVINAVTSLDEGTVAPTLTSANLTSINAKVAAVRATRIEAEQRWRALQNLPAGQLPEAQINGTLQALLAERTRLQTELVELRRRYNDDFPQIAGIVSQIEILDGQINRTGGEIKAAVRNAYTISLSQERALESELANVTNDKLAEQDKQVRYTVLEREAQALRNQLRALLDRYNQVSSAANVESSASSILDLASVPGSPYSPSLTRNLTLAIVLGLALAAGLVVVRETLDDRVRSLEDVERKVGLPLLGYTPFVEDSDMAFDRANRFGALMEAYSSVRAAIDFSLPRNRNVIMLTSSQASEGKSTTAVILAELFASLGRKTLLIDADIRRPSVSKLLGIERPKAGLVEMLLGHAEMSAVLLKGIHENLDILPMGEIPPNPTEIVASPEMRDFIEKVRHEYSLVIVDSTPVMGLADAPTMSRLVDGVVFVLEANRVPFGQVRSAVKRIRMAGGTISGLILTKYRALEAGQNYSYQYGYYQYNSSEK